MSHGQCESSLVMCHTIWFYDLSLMLQKVVVTFDHSTRPLKLKSSRFQMVSGVRFDLRNSESSIRFSSHNPESTSADVRFECVLPLKLGKSGIVNPKPVMNCRSLWVRRGLVKMSSVWRFALMCWRSTSPFWMHSQMKYLCTSICFVQTWSTGFQAR